MAGDGGFFFACCVGVNVAGVIAGGVDDDEIMVERSGLLDVLELKALPRPRLDSTNALISFLRSLTATDCSSL